MLNYIANWQFSQIVKFFQETKAKNLTAIDFDHENIALTIHVEMENGKYPPGIPHKAGQNTSDVVLQGKEALLFLDAMQKDFSNKKTKV